MYCRCTCTIVSINRTKYFYRDVHLYSIRPSTQHSLTTITTWFNNNNKWLWYSSSALIRYEVNQSEYDNQSYTVLMKLCPCGRYRLLNSVLYPNNHILKSSKMISNGLVLNVLVLAGNLKVGKPRLLCFLFKTQHRFLHRKHSSSYMFANSLNYSLRKFINWKRTGNFKLSYYVRFNTPNYSWLTRSTGCMHVSANASTYMLLVLFLHRKCFMIWIQC